MTFSLKFKCLIFITKGFDTQERAALETRVLDVMNNSDIEGEVFLESQIRSSIAKNLGIEVKQELQVESQ